MEIMLRHLKNTNSPFETFCYLWFDAKNRMFYLGKRKGHPDDGYTHSSSVMEAFTKKTIPTYMHRRILATGTEQEMIDLENKLLENRKRCPRRWDKYYNVVTCSPPPLCGEDNPNWKGGLATYNPSEYMRKWREKNPEKIRDYERKYREENPEKIRESKRKCREKNREHYREYYREYREKNAEHRRDYERQWREKNAEHRRDYQRKYRAKKKAEKAAGNGVDLTQFVGFN